MISANLPTTKLTQMKKHGVLAVNTEAQVNIGDYVQAMAPVQFLTNYRFVERENLDEYDGETLKMVLNGWFMHSPMNWPPSDSIQPLFLSFHMNVLAKQELLSEKSIAYFKAHEPIGCRDHYTADLLKAKGVDAYFSGCMTLTLGHKYRSTEKEDKCYFVDAYFDNSLSLGSLVKAVNSILFNWSVVKRICAKKHKSQTVKSLIRTAQFYSTYIQWFDERSLLNAEYVSQQSPIYSGYKNEELFSQAEGLIKKYSKAAFVVTSRIHCALPCLAIETPVYYVENKSQSLASSCRLNGLKQLFNIIGCEHGNLTPEFDFDSDGGWYYEQQSLGFNYRITDIQSALGRSQLKRLDQIITRRNEIADIYDAAFAGTWITGQWRDPADTASLHLYVVRTEDDGVPDRRNRLYNALREGGVAANLHYIPIYRQPYYREMGFEFADFPNAESYYRTAVSIPMYPTLPAEDQQHVIDIVLGSCNPA